MLDAILKSKFYSKCKSDIKLIRTRIEVIKRKRNATEKYLRNDVADLLKNGLDYNAYGRAEGLLAEMNRSQCYEIIDQYCQDILKHLSTMGKQRECPEECREAASSLMFAAARFADLPELRELRTVFSERYGKSLDYYVNKQFEEKIKSGLPLEMKLRLLQDVAAEYGLEWNSKALENKLFTESTYNKNIDKQNNDRKYSSGDPIDQSVQKKDRKFYIGPPVKEIQVDKSGKKVKPQEPTPVRKALQEEDEDKPLKQRWITPPYTKPEANKTKDNVGPAEPDEKRGQDDLTLKAKRTGKSVRTRSPRPSPVREIATGSEGHEREDVREKNKGKAAVGQRILKFLDGGPRDKRDEEERMLDRLLQRYSRKEEGRKEGELEAVLLEKEEKHRSLDGPSRLSSFPAGSSGQMENPKADARARARAASFHKDGHVHPKMPDYDDFVARLAAFRGK